MKPSTIATALVATALVGSIVVLEKEPPVVSTEPSTFAEIDAQGTVLRVIVADQAFIDSGSVGDPSRWIDTEGKKNYPGKEYTYEESLGEFVPPKTASTTVFDDVKAEWVEPTVTKKALVATSTKI